MFIAHDLSVVRHISDRVAVMYLGKLAELADAKISTPRPAIPTRARCSPPCRSRTPGSAASRSTFVLGGDVPNPINPPSGCRFHPRCPRAQETCAEHEPPLSPQAPSHEAACFFPLEKWPLTDAEMRGEGADGADNAALLHTVVVAADPDPPVELRLRR